MAKTQATTGAEAWGLAFDYDIFGNLLSAAVTQGTAPALSVSVNNKNQISKNQISSSGFSYDPSGDLLSDGSLNYTYDGEGRLKTAGSATHTYDGDGKRVEKSTGKLYWYPLTFPFAGGPRSGRSPRGP